ncbi:heme exporter protein CcmB [Sphingobacterium spiritivorum]|uniref:CcmB protein n=1 Tax=Sphingobacterium spiritivorum ATCC 33861 TaxID=525373 RepID=D7VH66_SPHSI|nr:heme exporter protein CcmB [Sphingobacterium spiritivorum]EFK59418.1 CcmB protein [Sphingobacterium spiritivorum ATCC 33861]QQT33901.1 heme exporter protein CcmB [Sphingobacterium spiritivorum]WQD34719.1 heme exporter protein CcmB [Sphingobacterium spiritivorum]SUI97809.1 CcmB protein [Sphingobacterium spiritivorum]
MNLFQQVKTLVYKDVLLEWRSKYAINGILLYVVSTVFVCYQAFTAVDSIVWNALFWIIMLFASINAISRSFVQESTNRQLYYYSIVDAKAIILSKIIYNTLVMILLSAIAFSVYSIIFRNPLADPLLYFISVILGSISFASVFTMVSGISSKAGNNSTLMAILSFPVIIPLLLVLIRLSKNAMDGLERSGSLDHIIVLLAINVITVTISLLLFPYLWRD